jgi:hypothetical protein
MHQKRVRDYLRFLVFSTNVTSRRLTTQLIPPWAPISTL